MRPDRLVVVVGTGTDVGKTWVSARLLRSLRAEGRRVAARKPAQSFDPGDDPSIRDAAVLGAASAELADVVCPPHRNYDVAMAPPMAAAALGRPSFCLDDLVGELRWPTDPVDVGLVETVGGVRSPMAVDGDSGGFCRALEPDLVVLVADAGLGTINAVRLSAGAVGLPTLVVLNRFDATSELHRANLVWLREVDGLWAVVLPGDEDELVGIAGGLTSRAG